jgi:peptidylprolyl isomerase/FKBP-type peptidyl-prolyl cis-trans isomerase FklB
MPRRLLVLIAVGLLGACGPAAGPDHLAQSKAFLAQNAKAEGVKTLPSGLQFKIVRNGPADGLRPQETDEVKVNYEGKLVSGKVFDSSYERGVPAALPLEGLIPGWIEALKLMRPGDEWILYVPPELGYGDRQSGEIPPNSVLIFRIELLGVLPGPGRIQQG